MYYNNSIMPNNLWHHQCLIVSLISLSHMQFLRSIDVISFLLLDIKEEKALFAFCKHSKLTTEKLSYSSFFIKRIIFIKYKIIWHNAVVLLKLNILILVLNFSEINYLTFCLKLCSLWACSKLLSYFGECFSLCAANISTTWSS